MAKRTIQDRVEQCISRMAVSLGRECPEVHTNSRMNRDLAFSSDEGVLIVLDLCEEFQIELPLDFNAVAHEDGKRDRTFSEVVTYVTGFVK